MKYIIMITIVIGLALVDFITGLIKAAIGHDISSQKMRIGGLHKIMEITIMATACGLEIGINALGKYYQSPELAKIAGAFTAGTVFAYIIGMELVSIIENYAESNPDAKWANGIIRFLRIFNDNDKEEN